MLTIIEDLPEHVLGLQAVGKVSAEDYRNVLIPAVEDMLAHHPKVRLLYVLGEQFEGFSGGAAWQDAKLGMKHFTSFERVAVVTDVDWIEGMVKAFGFALPGEVATFDNDELADAHAWITAPRSPGKLNFELLKERGVLLLEPQDELEVGDFERVGAAIDPYIDEVGGLKGLIIVAEEFPGWDNFAAMVSHFRFVREHQAKIRRVALVTSSRFLSALPRLAKLFVDAEIRRFEMEERDEAMDWVSD